MKKGFATIWVPLVLVVIIAVSAGTYYLGKTSSSSKSQISNTTSNSYQPTIPPTLQPSTLSETASWKTYKNTQYGYAIKYPDTWLISQDSTPEKTTFHNENATDKYYEVLFASVFVKESDKFKLQDIQNYGPFGFKNIEHDNMTFTILIYSYQYGGDSYENTQEHTKLAEEVLANMVSTFKFTSP